MRKGSAISPRGSSGALYAVIVGFALVSAVSARAETRVLFVGNSLTYFHGVPYLFASMSEDLYDRNVVVHSLLQPGGWLVQLLEQEHTLNRLADSPYDVVILQENGGALFCGSAESGPPERCLESIAAHRAIVDAAGHSETITVLLGTHRPEPIPEASERLARGEAWVRKEAGLDLHVPLAPAFFKGRSMWLELPWLDEDGGHPGWATAMLSACMTTKTCSERGVTHSRGYLILSRSGHRWSRCRLRA